jgi:hypothetical protein
LIFIDIIIATIAVASGAIGGYIFEKISEEPSKVS